MKVFTRIPNVRQFNFTLKDFSSINYFGKSWLVCSTSSFNLVCQFPFYIGYEYLSTNIVSLSESPNENILYTKTILINFS